MNPALDLPLIPLPKSVALEGGHVDLRSEPIGFAGFPREMLECCLPADLSWNTADVKSARVRLQLETHPARQNSDESYRIEISAAAGMTSVTAPHLNGARQALRTLAQLLTGYGQRLPAMVIDDRPDYPIRGAMLDISRTRVPLQEELFRIVDQLAKFKFNHLQLYTEHTFAYRGHEAVWQSADPLTAGEVRALDEHCRTRGVTLGANQNCFGHMERWLKHPEYQHLAETTGEWSFFGHPRRGPFSLCPTDPASLELVRDLLEQLLPNFSSRIVNLGCDETADVGQGRSRLQVAEQGFGRVYWGFVKRVIALAQAQGFQPQIWADMLLRDPPDDAADSLNGVTLLAWNYEPDGDFKGMCDRLKSLGGSVWVCPGTSSWRSITGRTRERSLNIARAASEGIAAAADGFMVTDWGDMGHQQQWPVSLIGLVNGAAKAWNAEAQFRADHFARLAWAAEPTRSGAGAAGLWMEELGNADLRLRQTGGTDRQPLRNASALFTDLHCPLAERKQWFDAPDWFEVIERLSALGRAAPRLGALSDELSQTVEVAHFAASRAVARRARSRAPGMFKRLADRLEELTEEHCRLWRLRSRPGGLEESSEHYRRVAAELRAEAFA